MKPPSDEAIPRQLDDYCERIVDSAFQVHTRLGPGLMENVYEVCLAHEMIRHGLKVERQVMLPVVYDNIQLDAGMRLDIWVERSVIVELKHVEKLLPVHQAQLLTYLKLTGCRLGLLINFNVPVIKLGIRRVAR